jgi:hypothetical protein
MNFIQEFNDGSRKYPSVEKDVREFHTQAAQAVDNSAQVTFKTLEDFYNNLRRSVPVQTLNEGKAIQNYATTRFHYWNQRNKLIGTVLKVITIGILAIIDHVGQQYAAQLSHFIHLNLKSLSEKIDVRRTELNGISLGSQSMKWRSIQDQMVWIAQVTKEKESLANLLPAMRNLFRDNLKNQLSSSDFWKNQARIDNVTNLWKATGCEDAFEGLSDEFNKKKALLAKVSQWEKLSIDKQLELVINLNTYGQLFHSQLIAISNHVVKNVSVAKMMELSNEEIFQSYLIIQALEESSASAVIANKSSLLKGELIEKALPDAFRTNDAAKKEKIKVLCGILEEDCMQAYELRKNVHASIKRGWKTDENKLSRQKKLLEMMLTHEKLFSVELEIVRISIFNSINELEKLSFEELRPYLEQLLLLEKVFEKSVPTHINIAQLKLLELIEKNWDSEEDRNRYAEIGKIIYLERVLQPLFFAERNFLIAVVNGIKYILDKNSSKDRRREYFNAIKAQLHFKLRCQGVKTTIPGIPSKESLEKLCLQPSLLSVAPFKLPQCKEKI